MGVVESQRVELPYAPRSERHWAIHDAIDAKRFGVVVCHRRFGKTVLAVNQLIKPALTLRRQRPRYAYIAPTYRQGKAIAWDYLKHYADAVPGRVFNETELRVDFGNGGQVRIYGADNPDALRGIYLDGVVFDEFGLMQGRIWSEVVRPALADRQGWAMFIGTPNGRNAFWELRDAASQDSDWFVIEHKASETGLIDAYELDAARRTMTSDEYAQEWECSFEASVKGAIYASELSEMREQGRIGVVPVAPELPVHTGWDLGVGDATAIWFAQVSGGQIRLIDYYEASGEGLPHYAAVLARKGYVYGKHYGPHDIAVRELGTGRSRIETARALGIAFEVVAAQPLEDGIHAARMMLARSWIDAQRCKAGLDALQNYRWSFNTRLNEFKSSPEHDWASHGSDALRTMASALSDRAPRRRANEQRVVNAGWMG